MAVTVITGTSSASGNHETKVMARLQKLEEYAQLLNDLKARIQAARTRVALAVNREVITLYWDMGKMIVERQQEHGWGDAVIDRLSQDLRREFPDNKGFSRSNLFRMRTFYSGSLSQLAPMTRGFIGKGFSKDDRITTRGFSHC